MKSVDTITLGDLIQILQEAQAEHGPDVPVVTSSDYGDHHHTQQAHMFEGSFTLTFLKKSAYSSSGFKVTEEDEEDEESITGEESPKVLLIS